MGNNSQIQWTDATWNIARGCTKVDEDCKFCYMYRDSFNSSRYDPLQVVKTTSVFNMPLKYKPTTSQCWDGAPLIFTCSLTDFFHEACDRYRHEAWDIIRRCSHLTFQILTKRPERILQCLPDDWGDGWDNVWLGTSVGSPKGMQRMITLSSPAIKAKVKFISIEPLHQFIDLYSAITKVRGALGAASFHSLAAFHWVIVGGESGNEIGKYRYRPCQLEWIEKVVSQAQFFHIPVFVKQLGTHLSKQLGITRHGGNIEEFPAHLRIREFPKQQHT